MKTIIENAFIEILSGIAQIHKDGGVMFQSKCGDPITVSFPTQSPTYAMVRAYWENGTKCWEIEYQQGQKHGKNIGWRKDGTKYWEVEYHHGERVSENRY